MSSHDEELQNKIEKNGAASEGVDSLAYKKVFDALKKEPDFYLSSNFADKVVARIEAKKESSTDSIWIALGIVSFIVAAIISIALTDFKLNFGALKFINGYPGLIIFGIAFLLVLQWIDKKLVRPATEV